jgi:hypothetical protein
VTGNSFVRGFNGREKREIAKLMKKESGKIFVDRRWNIMCAVL